MSAWPFLFAAGKVLDYQLIVCPRPFADKQRMGAFRRWVGPLAEHLTSAPTRAESSEPLMKDYIVVYSCQTARVKDAAVTDCSHRPVHVVTGLVFAKSEATSADFDARANEMAAKQRSLLWPRFESFWERITPPAEIETSEPVIPRTRTTSSPSPSRFARLVRLHAEVLASRLPVYPAMAAAVVLMFVAGIAAGGISFHRSIGDARAPAIATPSSLAGDTRAARYRASKLLSSKVFDINSRPVGTIGDLVIGEDGKAALVIINVDGEPGSPGKPVGVDLHHISANDGHLVLDLTRDQLSAAPEYHVDAVIEAVGAALPVDNRHLGSSQSGK